MNPKNGTFFRLDSIFLRLRLEDYEGKDRWTRPVERVSWEDAVEFCLRLSKKTEKKYRLPTEAEWEYACRSVKSDQLSVNSENLTVKEWNEKYNQPFHFGETIITKLANYDGNYTYNYTYGEGVKGEYKRQTTPVGYFKVANNFGLSDMHGNVWEWCEDDWHDNYESVPTDGSAWRSGNRNRKVIRGVLGASILMSAVRRTASTIPAATVTPFSVFVLCVSSQKLHSPLPSCP